MRNSLVPFITMNTGVHYCYGGREHVQDGCNMIMVFIFQYALIHQSEARTTRGVKTYMLRPLFYILLSLRIVKCHFVTLRIWTVQKLHSKLCARELTL